MRRCTVVVAALILQGCAITWPVCTDVYVDAVRLHIWDFWGGKLDSTPTGILTDGDYRETMEADEGFQTHVMYGGGDRVGGPYDIEVRAAGYRTWELDNVDVEMDHNCERPAQTIPIAVEMFPLRAP